MLENKCFPVADEEGTNTPTMLCKECFKVSCERCGEEVIGEGAVKCEDGAVFHPECLRCTRCLILLEGSSFSIDGDLVCEGCVKAEVRYA